MSLENAALLDRELDAILQTAMDNFVITDGEGVIIRANANCHAIYGTSEGYFIGRSVFELEQTGILCPSVTAMVIRQRARAKVMQTTRTGRLVLATGVPVLAEDGSLLRVISSSYDLTEVELLRAEYEMLQARAVGVSPPEPAPEDAPRVHTAGDLVYRSRQMAEVVELIRRIARTDVSVLFLGETGVGKTELARLLHTSSARARGRFVALNCSTVPEPLFEAQLFGYEAGAFTGADRHGKVGLIEMADHGTLFLDEIGELPLAVQAKLLTVLEDRSVRRLGGTTEKGIDFRIVASSNCNLKELVERGAFRADLYYRLSVFPITVPPLRLRTADIGPLAELFVRRFNIQYGSGKMLGESTLRRLERHAWPGNIREFRNVLERMWLSSPGGELVLSGALLDDDEGVTPGAAAATARGTTPEPAAHGETDSWPQAPTLREALDRVERELLLEARRTARTTYEIAERLGISQPSVVRKLKRHGIDA